MASSSFQSSVLLFFFFFSLSAIASPWEKFLDLSGCRPGDTNPVLPDLKKYLQHFGYLHVNENQLTDSFDDDLGSALCTYQQNFNLQVTGVLDDLTIKQLITPRCGVPDIINNTTSMASGTRGTLHYPYAQGGSRWPPDKMHLKYAIDDEMDYTAAITNAFAMAFGRWSALTNFTFTKVSPNHTADIRIGFYSGEHGDGLPFDGEGGVIAHAAFPPIGTFHVDLAEEWFECEPKSINSVDLESASVHETGTYWGLTTRR